MFNKRRSELNDVLERASYKENDQEISSELALEMFHAYLTRAKEEGGIVYVIGNGGSAGIASHFSVDLVKALKIPSATLYDSNLITCISNDFGYEYSFSKPLETMLKPNDMVVAISSSGQSKNIINGAMVAKEKDVPLITLSGFSSSNPLRALGALNFWLDSSDYGLVEIGHAFLLHTVTDTRKHYSELSSMTMAHG